MLMNKLGPPPGGAPSAPTGPPMGGPPPQAQPPADPVMHALQTLQQAGVPAQILQAAAQALQQGQGGGQPPAAPQGGVYG